MYVDGKAVGWESNQSPLKIRIGGFPGAEMYAEYIMRNAGLEEAQAGIRIARRNINNLRYADDTTLMAENKEELKIKSLQVKVKEDSEKASLNLHSEN